MSFGDKVFAGFLGILITFVLSVLGMLGMLVAGHAANPDQAQANVEKVYPPPAVVHVTPGNKFCFFVTLPDGSTHTVRCMNLWNDDISSDVVVVPPVAEPAWHQEAVDAGKAEYYLDEHHERQWRWKP